MNEAALPTSPEELDAYLDWRLEALLNGLKVVRDRPAVICLPAEELP